MSSLSPEDWKSWLEWIGVGLLLLTFLVGYGVLHFGNQVQARKDEQLRKFEADLVEAKTKLSEQQERTAKAEKDLLNLQDRLIRQGSRSALLYGERRGHVIAALKPFAGQKSQIRFCLEQSRDNETMSLTLLLDAVIEKAGWSLGPPVPINCGGTGIFISVNPKASRRTREAAEVLRAALNDVPLKVNDKVQELTESELELPNPIPTFTQNGTRVDPLDVGKDTEVVVIQVLAHPL